MPEVARPVCLSALLLAFLGAPSFAQDAREGAGAITGLVTVGGKPAPGVIVLAMPAVSARHSDPTTARARPMKTTTGEDGRYRLDGLAAGRYHVNVHAPALVAASGDDSSPFGRPVAVADGETTEGVDFALTPGGVITGRVTDANGRPAIAEIISLKQVDGGSSSPIHAYNTRGMYLTDDRGVYRIYGLSPGRYLVGVGGQNMWRMLVPGSIRENATLTYHPGVTEESKATVVEVKAGGEASGIDIRLGPPAKTYQVSGRVVDARTGRPVADVMVSYTEIEDSHTDRDIGGFSASDARGEFRFDGVPPGQYMATATLMEESDYIAEPLPFEVTGADKTGLEIRLHRGGSISGVAVIEGYGEADAAALLSQMVLVTDLSGFPGPIFRPSDADHKTIAPDGSFLIRGLKPGKARIQAISLGESRALKLTRVERNGVPQPDGVEVRAGEQVTGVRLVFSYGTGVIHGQVILTGRRLPVGMRPEITYRRVGDEPQEFGFAEVDPDGRFVIGHLIPGNYEVEVKLLGQERDDQSPEQSPSAKQTVTVTGGVPAEVTLTLDLRGRN